MFPVFCAPAGLRTAHDLSRRNKSTLRATIPLSAVQRFGFVQIDCQLKNSTNKLPLDRRITGSYVKMLSNEDKAINDFGIQR